MIYNLAQLLRAKFPTETFYVNGRVLLAGQTAIPDRCVLLTDPGGTEQPWTQYQHLTVQVIARDVDAPHARELAHSVFEYLTGRFGVVLPAITVDGVVHAAVLTAQISAIQVPYNLGADEEGRIEYANNYQVIRER